MIKETSIDFDKSSYSKLIRSSLLIAGNSLPTLAIVAYFSGWQYVNEYFSAFGINRSTFSFTDYTTFLYAFSVVTKAPSLICELNLKSSIGIFSLLMLIMGPIFMRQLKVNFNRFPLLKAWSWIWLILALFFISQEAGKIEAKKTLNKEARQVEVFFSESYKKNLIAVEGKEYGKQKFEELLEASHLGAFAIIRKDANETILLQFGTKGDHHEIPLDILRVNNNHIVSITYKAPKLN